MAEISRPWSGTILGDSGPYSNDNWTDTWDSLFSVDNTVQAPLRGRAGELVVTGVGSPISVNTGEALVDGAWYQNTIAVNVVVPTPAGAVRIDRIVLEKVWATQTIRIARVAGVEGGGAPALTQNDGVTWQVSLAQASITVGGVITVTDERVFVESSAAVSFDDTVGNPEDVNAGAAADGTDIVAARLDHIHDYGSAGAAAGELLIADGAAGAAWGRLGIYDHEVTTTTVVSTAAETEFYGFTLAANDMPADGLLWGKVLCTFENGSGAARDEIFRLKLGATTLCTQQLNNIPVVALVGLEIRWAIGNIDNDSVQYAQLQPMFLAEVVGVATTAIPYDTGNMDDGAGAEDTTGPLAVSLTIEHEVNNANLALNAKLAWTYLAA